MVLLKRQNWILKLFRSGPLSAGMIRAADGGKKYRILIANAYQLIIARIFAADMIRAADGIKPGILSAAKIRDIQLI